jgi:hypothetical protein
MNARARTQGPRRPGWLRHASSATTAGRLPTLLLAALPVPLAIVSLSFADTVANHAGTITFHASASPHQLPRHRAVPISLHVSGRVRLRPGQSPPALRRITVSVNPHAELSTAGLPSCPAARIRSLTSRRTLALCADSLIGVGDFSADVKVPAQAPFPSYGRLLVFASGSRRHPRLLGQVFGTRPVPTAHLLAISFRPSAGRRGAALSVALPAINTDWGHVTGFHLTLHRTYRYRGRPRSFISASCPAPPGALRIPFVAARGQYFFADGHTVTRIVTRTCTVAQNRPRL